MKNLVITLDCGMMWIAETKMNLFVKKYEIHLVLFSIIVISVSLTSPSTSSHKSEAFTEKLPNLVRNTVFFEKPAL